MLLDTVNGCCKCYWSITVSGFCWWLLARTTDIGCCKYCWWQLLQSIRNFYLNRKCRKMSKYSIWITLIDHFNLPVIQLSDCWYDKRILKQLLLSLRNFYLIRKCRKMSKYSQYVTTILEQWEQQHKNSARIDPVRVLCEDHHYIIKSQKQWNRTLSS